MRCLFCKGLITSDEKIAYLMTNNFLRQRTMSCSSPNEQTQGFTNVLWNWLRSLCWSVPSIKNDKFITREGIWQYFTKSELVATLHDYTGGYLWCLNLLFYSYLFLYIFVDTTFVYSEQLWKKNNELRLLTNNEINS